MTSQTTEQNTVQPAAVVRGFIEQAWNQHAPEMLERYLHPDFVDHDNRTKLSGIAGMQEWLRIMNATFDHQTIIEDLICENDRAALRLTFKVVQIGEFRGVPASGKTAQTVGYRFFRLADGKIIEHWANIDGTKLVEQLTTA